MIAKIKYAKDRTELAFVEVDDYRIQKGDRISLNAQLFMVDEVILFIDSTTNTMAQIVYVE